MATEFRLSDEDHKTFAAEDAPEWVLFDPDALSSTPFDQQHPWESEIRKSHPGTSLVTLIAEEFAEYTGLGIKGMVWLAWKMAGLETPKFKDFNIQTLKVKYRTLDGEAEVGDEQDDDADPPAEGSTEPSSEPTAS